MLEDLSCAVDVAVVDCFAFPRFDLQAGLDDVGRCSQIGSRHTGDSTSGKEL